MRRLRSLRRAFTWWFAATLVALYGVTSTALWLQSRATARGFAILTLKNEAEAVSAYLAASPSMDAPELSEPEHSALQLWIRVIDGDRIVAATPGIPELPVEPRPPSSGSVDFVRYVSAPGPLAIVQHDIGGRRAGMVVEAVGSLEPLRRRERKLGIGLLLGGLGVIPIAALGGRWLAGRALRSLEALVRSIRRLDTRRPEQRLELPRTAFDEVETVAAAFNDLLARLQATFEGMRRFTADASHEIRNPLSVLRTGLEVALRRPRSTEEYQVLLRQNLREIERLQAVVEGLLALARQEPGREVSLVRTRLDLSTLLTQSLESFAIVAAERRLVLDARVPRGLTLDGDAGLLRLIVFNLLDNAIKHSPEGGRVLVVAASEEGALRFRVSDEGPGIPPAERPHLFERYFRGGRTAAQGGTGGLGLSVVQWVAEAHGGSVRLVEDEPGATFEVLLPLRA